MKTIGVLGLQGAVQEHVSHIDAVGCKSVVVKTVEQLEHIDGLIIPGGESTTMRRFIDQYGFLEPLMKFGKQKPIYGTCAGMVLLANRLAGGEKPHLQLIDITVKRNAFGRQRDSFEAKLNVKAMETPFPAVFIRAPFVEEAGANVEILAEYEGHIVAARQDHILVTAFHPELTDDTRFMKLFLQMVKLNKSASTL
ncbi:pyridoxal 5'-phosphate synthase glutaminase subunit PdxT [Bacillus sp. AGMB 02131]|uniref:Pyridoxal 5'-phosphate synthase subunit PdxT n=1 Tax=Peribacillus faecalis TaxID=2772559 RepID=A0A927CX91_9BACI|nr:pyridoxal 5'-phosphate synthase glutaminase subunit PdxT [Peribacillus faecalis]MBD3108746.1 pyridoxal 5'-phosphate synthase glutaminase subunit PdxT [Peribacillus faecalis]